ncbi:TonB-dependent receptor plug domain-containing protein [Weeksellaceae bacterium TAE3-ERU29]|nr:TonB-dependent receptor plug domain-containing protein [Weeksellaceae bacterium TAE3-ERU29]
MKFRILFLCIFIGSFSCWGQEVLIQGKVTDDEKEPLINVVIREKDTDNYSYSDENGFYSITVKAGKNTLEYYYYGEVQKEVKVNFSGGKNQLPNVIIAGRSVNLDEVVVLGKTIIDKLQESSYNVSAIDARPFHNSSADLTKVIENAPGIKIREDGGLGSRTNININGLSGRHVRVFIDGMPMDAMGSAFQINNLSTNLAERIEVYKGVVPVSFGADALGGAINIVTKEPKGLYLDASYSYGSFNTHKTFVNAGYTSKSGFTTQINAFQNYSDNDYYIKAKIKDFSTNLLSKEEKKVRRFHNKYHNETIIAKVGFINKWYADKFLLGFTFGNEYDEIQHPAYINIAFGEKYQTAKIIMPSLTYAKKSFLFNNLDFQLTANYNLGGGNNYDLSNKEYNWLGESRESNSLGEIQYSNFEYHYNNLSVNANLKYTLNSRHHLVFNSVSSLFSRKANEKTDAEDYTNLEPRINNRYINGLSLNSAFSDKINTTLFAKSYAYKASAFLNLSQQSGIFNFRTVTKDESLFGYGLTATYFIKDNFQVKTNYELARRLPVSRELFGEVFGFYIANFDLKPESSHNFNLGAIYSLDISKNSTFSVDLNLFYRHTKDFIRLNVNYSQGEGSYLNEDLVKTIGLDTDIRYSYRNIFSINANISYLNPKLYKEKSVLNPSTLPNMPTFFANTNATYVLLNNNAKKLTASYGVRFINEFLYDYDIYKASNRAKIPTQWSHDFFLTYSWGKGRYNLSADVKNIFDADLYDNYSLQKPGRAFSVKFRYFINKYN